MTESATSEHDLRVGSKRGDLLARVFGWRAGMALDGAAFDRWRWMRRLIRPGVRTLDAGCGSGWFALYLATRGCPTVGVSFNSAANDAARRRARALGIANVSIHDGDLRALDRFGPGLGTFDQAICFETIEHIRDDRKLIRDLASRLNEGGLLLLTTPSSAHRRLLGEELDPDEAGGHVRWGTSHIELEELMLAADLIPVDKTFLCGLMTQKVFELTFRLSHLVGHRVAAVITVPLRVLALVDRPLTELLGYPYLCVGVAAVKRRAT